MTDVRSLNARAEAAWDAEAARKKEENLVFLRCRHEAVQWGANAAMFEQHGPRTEAMEREIVRQVAEDAARRRQAKLQPAPLSAAPEPVPKRQRRPAPVLARAPVPVPHAPLPPLWLLEQLWADSLA